MAVGEGFPLPQDHVPPIKIEILSPVAFSLDKGSWAWYTLLCQSMLYFGGRYERKTEGSGHL